MYICNVCGVLFEEPSKIGEVHYELDEKAVEYFSCCPNCGDTDFVEAVQCDYCGEDFRESELIGGTLCPDCLDEIIHGRQDVVKAFIMQDQAIFAEFVHNYDGLKPEVEE